MIFEGSRDLLDLVPVDSPKLGPAPSMKQRDLINKLTDELRGLDADLAEAAGEYTAHMDRENLWTPGRDGNVSRWIDRLIAKIRDLKKAQAVELEDGMYTLGSEIYKVQHAVHGSGRQYAKVLVPGQPGERATFAYVPGVVQRLRPENRMTLEQAKEFGALYGTCCQCGRVLTNEDSIEAGIGPICAGKI